MSSFRQILGELPTLKNDLDLSDEDRDLRSKLSLGLSGFEEVQELLADQVAEGFVGAEFALDVTSRLTLLDPYLAKDHVLRS